MSKTSNANSSPERRAIWGVLRQNRTLLVTIGVVGLLEAGLLLVVPYVSRLQIEVLEGRSVSALQWMGRSPWNLLLVALGVLLAAHLLSEVFSAVSNVLDVRAREKLSIDTERVLYDKLTTFDAGFLANPRNRKLVYALFEVTNLSHGAVSFAATQARVGVLVLGILPILAATDLYVFGIVMAAAALQLIVLRLRVKRENAYRLYKERRLARINELRFLLRHHFHQLLGVSGQDRVLPRYWAMRADATELETGEAKLQLRYRLAHHVLEQLALFGVGAFVGLRVLQGQVSIGVFTMVLLYAFTLLGALTQVNESLGEWYRLRSVMSQLGFYLRLEPRVAIAPGSEQTPPPEGDLAVDGVAFRYPSLRKSEQAYLEHLIAVLKLAHEKREAYPSEYELVEDWKAVLAQGSREFPTVLQDASCVFRRGEITALVGRNGSGKTTLLNLLLRGYDPDRGTVRFDSRAATELHPARVRRSVSLVAQEPFLLESFSVRDNLMFGVDDDLDEDRIWEVLDSLDFAEEVRALPRGLDTLLGDEVGLSGGQSQLLVVARAILQDRPYLLLDEGTNQLDAEHELRIVEALQRLKREAVVILVTHRMTTARRADRIHVLDKGHIVESGDHAALVATADGLYRHFWEIQVVN